MISNNSPTAMAMVQDLQKNNSYKLQFVTSPSLPLTPLSGQGTVNITSQYSCGVGRLSPPMKQDWSTGGAINALYTVQNVTAPSMHASLCSSWWRGGF
jgi:hypothetical protein